MQEIVLSVENLGKNYWLYPSNFRRIVGSFISPAKIGAIPMTALSGLSFELRRGEAIALIGKNGAGKSTALQILAGIVQPTEGRFSVKGRICALLELGSGFNPEFTGRENIAIAGAIAGLTKTEISNAEEEIIAFADIGSYIDQPVKFYSSGMFVRLAFSVAVAGSPELLIVDEALAVGDIFFRQKCYDRLYEMRKKGMAVILVTHSIMDVLEFCDSAIFLETGQVIYQGAPKEAITRYVLSLQSNSLSSVKKLGLEENIGHSREQEDGHPWPHLIPHFVEIKAEEHQLSSRCRLLSVCLTDENDNPSTLFNQGGKLRLYMVCYVESTAGKIPAASFGIWNSRGVLVCNQGTPAYENLSIPAEINEPSLVFVCHEITIDLAVDEYVFNVSFSEVDYTTYKARHMISWERWIEATERIMNVGAIGSFTIQAPLTRLPARFLGAGIVNLPVQGHYFVKPLTNKAIS